jgi:hypothetical protein
MPPEGVRPPADAVDPDPLAATGTIGPRALDRDLEDVGADRPFDTGQVPTPADQLAVGAGPVRTAPAKQRDRLEEARLAGCVRAPDQMRPGVEGGVDRRVTAQVEG